MKGHYSRIMLMGAAMAGLAVTGCNSNRLEPESGQPAASAVIPSAGSSRSATPVPGNEGSRAGVGGAGAPVGRTAGDRFSDSWTTFNVTSALYADPRFAKDGLKVEVRNGVATLSGRVNSQGGKEFATQIARGIEGVVKVENQLVVVDEAEKGSVHEKNDQIQERGGGLPASNSPLKDRSQ